MAIPSWYQAQIPTTIPAPTKIVKDIHHIMVSTIIGSTIQPNNLNVSTLFTSTVQTNVLHVNSLVGSSIQTNAFRSYTTTISTFQANAISFTTLFGSTIQANTLQYSTIIGDIIQTNTQYAQFITGNSVQTNALYVSSMIGNSIQTNTSATSSLLNGTMTTPILYSDSSMGSTIQTKQLNVSTVVSDSIQQNILYVSTLIGSTLIGSIFQINASNVSSAIGNTIQTNTLQVSTLSGSTIQTDSFIISTINVTNTNMIQMNRLHVATVIGSTITCSTIQTNRLGTSYEIVSILGEYITFDLGTGGNYHNQYSQRIDGGNPRVDKINFMGSADGILWTNLGLYQGVISSIDIGVTRQIFNYRLSNARYLRIHFIEINNGAFAGALLFHFCNISNNGGINLFPTSFDNISLSPNIRPGQLYYQTDTIQIDLANTYSPTNTYTTGYYTGNVYTIAVDNTISNTISTLTTSSIQTNLLYFSTLTGSTIQTNTLQVNTLLGSTFINSTIQTNTMNTSSLIVGTVQMNTIVGSTIIVSSIKTNQIGTNIVSGNAILMNRLNTSTVIVSSIQTNQLNTDIITHNTIQMNILNGNRTVIRDNQRTIAGEYITFDVGSMYIGRYHNCFLQRVWPEYAYPNKIAFFGSNDGISWADLGTSVMTTSYTENYAENQIFKYTLSDNRYLRIIFIEITNGSTNQLSMSYKISNDGIYDVYPNSINDISLSVNIFPGVPYSAFNYFYVNLANTYSPTNEGSIGYYTGSLSTTASITIPNVNKNTIANTAIGSTIQSDTFIGGTVHVNVMTGSTIIGSTIQILQFNISTLVGSTIVGSNLQPNRILITDGNKALSTSAVLASQLSYISGLMSQAGGTGQVNIWTAANTFTVAPVFTGLAIATPLYIMGLSNSNQLLRYIQDTQSIIGTLTTNYIPYASAVSTLTNSIIYRVNDTDIAIGQTTSTFPTGTATTVSIAGTLQTTRVAAGTGFFSKIVMADKRSGLNGTVISGNQGCNFYMGTMNNGTGNLTDALYLNSGSDGSSGNANVVMFNKNEIGMRIFQGAVGDMSPFTTYKDAVMIDANSGNIVVGQNSDTDGITFGPNLSTSYLKMGAGTNRVSTNVSQIITTNGDLYADCATNEKILQLNFYVKDVATSYINSYTPWTHTGKFTATGNIDVRWGITPSEWYTNLSDNGMYWSSPTYNRGFVSSEYILSPNVPANKYGTVATYGSGKNGWSGWGIGSKVCLMTDGNIILFHDNTFGWVIWAPDKTKQLLLLGGGSVQCSQEPERFLIFTNGVNKEWGFFYITNAGLYGSSSDERIKKNIKPIDAEQSIAFIRGIIPSYFCLKNEPIQIDTTETGQVEQIDCEQSGFIAQNLLESAKKAGLPQSTVSNSYDYEQELSLPEEERKTLLGISEMPLLTHSYNALKGTMKKQDLQQTQIDEISNKCSMIDTGLTALQEIVRQNADLLQKLLAKT
jgi:hypothetical protein